MPGPENIEDAADAQDQAEALDETNYDLREERSEMRTFEQLPDVLDVTSEPSDSDEDEGFGDDNLRDDGVERRVVASNDDAESLDRRLDEGLKESFPASDPPAVTPHRD